MIARKSIFTFRPGLAILEDFSFLCLGSIEFRSFGQCPPIRYMSRRKASMAPPSPHPSAVTKMLQVSLDLFRLQCGGFSKPNGLLTRRLAMKTWIAPLALAVGILLIGGVWLQGQTAKGPD